MSGKIVFMRLVRFVIAGGIGLSTNLAILHLLVVSGMYYLLASVIAVSLSTVVGFLIQRLWTFQVRSVAQIHTQFVWYATVTAGNIALNTLIVYALVDYVGVWYLFAQMVASAIVAVWSYVLYSKFIFAATATSDVLQ